MFTQTAMWDGKSIAEVYHMYFPKLRSWVLRNSGNAEDAEDVFQETCIAIFKHVKEGKKIDPGKLGGFLMIIAKRIWLNKLRKRKKSHMISVSEHLNKIPHEQVDMDSLSEDAAQIASLHHCRSKLNPNDQKVLRLFYEEKKSVKEIADYFGITVQSAKTKKYRAILQLKKCFNLKKR